MQPYEQVMRVKMSPTTLQKPCPYFYLEPLQKLAKTALRHHAYIVEAATTSPSGYFILDLVGPTTQACLVNGKS